MNCPRIENQLVHVGISFLLSSIPLCLEAQDTTPNDTNFIHGDSHVLVDNGAWSWFMDERLMVDQGRLIVGSARANGTFKDQQLPGWGNIELSILDLKSGEKDLVILHEGFEQDDHNTPGLLILQDGRYLAAYSKHNQETKFYFRKSTNPGDPYQWDPVEVFTTPGKAGNFSGDSITYSNPIRVPAEDNRIYLLHRGVGNDPNYLFSDNDAKSWQYGGRMFIGRDGYSPYVKYASNGRNRIHFVATEDHPRNFDNSLFHGYLENGKLRLSDGVELGTLAEGQETPLRAWDFTKVYQGGATNVAWMSDIHLDVNERPVILFTTQRDGKDLSRRQGGMDHRFHIARWTGEEWESNEIAHAGTRLYPGEDDYTGLGAIDPQNTNILVISTDAHPITGEPLISKADNLRHHELFKGITRDNGESWQWSPVTSNSDADNLRPLVSVWKNADRTIIVWMRGSYTNNRGEWTSKVITTIFE